MSENLLADQQTPDTGIDLDTRLYGTTEDEPGRVSEHREKSGAFTPETASKAAKGRWRTDPQGLAAAVRKIVDRAPALTPEQRELIRAALTLPAGTAKQQ